MLGAELFALACRSRSVILRQPHPTSLATMPMLDKPWLSSYPLPTSALRELRRRARAPKLEAHHLLLRLGAPIGQLLVENKNMGLKWMGLLNIIIGSFFCVGLCFVPE